MDRTVQLFATCLVDGFHPAVGAATTELLEAHGWTVSFPFDQTCCGQPAMNVGATEEARKMAAHTLDVLDPTPGPIVIPSGSCADMIIHHYLGLFERGSTRHSQAERVAARTTELTAFLVDRLGVTDVGASCDGCTFAYHPSCHGLRNLGLERQSKDLLDAVAGAQRVEIEHETQCCGFGGLFSVELPEVSAALMNAKLDAVEATGADVLVTSDVSCMMHLAGGLERRGSSVQTRHIAELLAEGRQ